MSQNHKRVVWSEGMALDPHHFQQWERHRAGVLNARLRAVAPQGWGLAHCRIDEDRLANGEFALSACTAVMPDGLVVDVPEGSPAPDVRNVQEHLAATDDSVRVLLAVPAEQSGGRNVQLRGADHDRRPRYVAERATRVDENTGDNRRPVEVAHVNVLVRFSTEPQEGYSTLPVAEVERTGGGFRLRDDFVPPCLHVRASDRLVELARRLLELLVAKREELTEYKEKVFAQRELSPSDLTSLHRLGLLNAFIPRVDHHRSGGRHHPQDLFRTLAALAGRLSTYVEAPASAPQSLPTYEHSAPTEPFSRIERALRRMLGEATPTTDYTQFDLQRKRENLLVTSVEASVLDASQLFLVTRSEDHSEAELTRSLPEMLRVASPETIDDVLQSYTQALTVTPTRRLPSNMPVDNQATYFRLEKQGPFWDSICEEEGIAVFIPSDFQGVDVEFIAAS